MPHSHVNAHRGVIILVLGILSWAGLGIFTAPFAWVMGRNDLASMDAGTMDPEGRGLTQAGMILGMVMTILCVIGAIVVIGMLALGLGFAAVSSS